MSETAAFLGRVGLFRGLPDDALALVGALLTTQHLAAGQVLFTEGEPADSFCIVQSGTLAVTTVIGGEERELGRLFAGEFLGEIALLSDTTRTATVRAVSDAVLLRLAAEDFGQLVADHPGLQTAIADAAARRQARSLRTALEVERRNLASLLVERQSVRVGRAPDNDLVFGSVNVAEHHAVVRRLDDGEVELVDLGTGAGTFVNGVAVRGAKVLRDADEVVLGDQRFLFDRERPVAVVQPHGVRIDVVKVGKTVRGGKVLLRDITLSILPGEFVAIVGGSGAGKTTLLDALAGLRPATSGKVLYNGRDSSRERDQYRHVLGYVPQDDIIHTDLSLRRTLAHSARLRLPRDTSKASVASAVDRQLHDLGLEERADVVVSKLSGGQRKRASIAIELLTEPRVCFLDEPTSGLDPATDRSMMRLLRQMADDGRTIVLTTHATRNARLCDKLVVLARDGHLAFYGAPEEALRHFGVDDFDDIYDRLEEDEPARWAERFVGTPAHRAVSAGIPPIADAAAEAAPLDSSGPRRGVRESLHQFRALSRRNLALHLPPQHLMPVLMQPVVIALLILALFRSDIFQTDTDNPTAALQMIYTFDFTMFLFGLLFGAQEIVREWAVFRRERSVGVRVVPYVLSKVSFLAPMLALVAVAITGLFRLTGRLPDAGLDVYGPLVVTLVLTGWAGMAMSLLISSVVRTAQQATDLLTPWIAPQVLFAGALFAVPSMNMAGRLLSNITAVRWSFEASSRVTELKSFFAATESEIGQSMLLQYADSFRWAPSAYWTILAAFVVVPLVLAAVVLTRRSRPA